MPAIPPHDPNKQWKLKGFLAGRFRNGRREIRVERDDGTKTWEPDHCVDGKVLEEINRKSERDVKRALNVKLKKKYKQKKILSQIPPSPQNKHKCVINLYKTNQIK